MRASYIKKNSHTQGEAGRRVDAVRDICKLTGISRGEWLELFFELGCKYVEWTTVSRVLIADELQNPERGFWAWWLDFYVRHDEYLLSIDGVERFGRDVYCTLKELIIYNRYKL